MHISQLFDRGGGEGLQIIDKGGGGGKSLIECSAREEGTDKRGKKQCSLPVGVPIAMLNSRICFFQGNLSKESAREKELELSQP